MKQRHVMGRVVAAVIVGLTCLSGSASAAMYDFEDTIEQWGPFGLFDAAYVNQGCPIRYAHDLNQEVNFAAGDHVVAAWLELDFTNDSIEFGGDSYKVTGVVRWDYREFATVAYDGQSWVDVTPGGEVDDGAYSIVLDIDWLNDNGKLDVMVAVSNKCCSADAWLDASRVYGTAENAVVPVPGAVLLGALGLTAAGRKLRRFI